MRRNWSFSETAFLFNKNFGKTYLFMALSYQLKYALKNSINYFKILVGKLMYIFLRHQVHIQGNSQSSMAFLIKVYENLSFLSISVYRGALIGLIPSDAEKWPPEIFKN
jgi:hypothetical protein